MSARKRIATAQLASGVRLAICVRKSDAPAATANANASTPAAWPDPGTHPSNRSTEKGSKIPACGVALRVSHGR
jgi:hypothetical protein